MAINIYWGFEGASGTQLLLEPLVPVLKDLKTNNNTIQGKGFEEYQRCPGYIKYFNNTYVAKAVSDLTITHSVHNNEVRLEGNSLNLKVYPPTSYDKDYQLIQIAWNWLLFSDTDIEVSQIPSTLHSTEVNNVFSASGTMNISKWFRPIRPAFFMRRNSTINIKTGDALFYLKVHTHKPVQLKNFEVTEEVWKLAKDCTDVKDHKKRMSLKALYSLFVNRKYPSKVLRTIKRNLTKY